MKIADKLIQEFDIQFKPDQIDGFKYNALEMIVQEFSDLYQIKKYVLANSLLKN